MPSQSLTVAEYSDVVIRKYLQRAFDEDEVKNKTVAAEEVYVLLRKLMDAAGGKSEDAKAPLKAIRNAIDTICAHKGNAAPEIGALFELLARLEELCEERIAAATDPIGGEAVQNVLRYRLIRLVTGETWDAFPSLKLRTLQLFFSIMVRENQRLLEAGRDQPSLRLGRSLSIGRSRTSRELGPRQQGKWAESFNDIQRMTGAKLLPLVKMLLAENLQLSTVTASIDQPSSEIPATPDQQTAPKSAGEDISSPPQEQKKTGDSLAQPIIADDLLGLESSHPMEPTSSQRSSSPSRSTPTTSAEDPFASLAEGRTTGHPVPITTLHTQFQSMSMSDRSTLHQPVRAPSAASSFSSMMTGSAPPTGVQTPPVHYQRPAGQTAFMSMPQDHHHPAVHSDPLERYGSGAYQGIQINGSGSLPLSVGSPMQQQWSGSLQRASSNGIPLGTPPHAHYPVQYGSVGNNASLASVAAFDANFDASSPYLGSSQPFEDNRFAEVSPSGIPPRRPMPPAAAPAMRAAGQ